VLAPDGELEIGISWTPRVQKTALNMACHGPAGMRSMSVVPDRSIDLDLS
jgi:hypothetical protein